MPKLTVHSATNPDLRREVDAENFVKSIEAAREAQRRGQETALAMLGPLMTILGGDGTPFDVKAGQDISRDRARFSADSLPERGTLASTFSPAAALAYSAMPQNPFEPPKIKGKARRIAMDAVMAQEPGRGQQLLINDKEATLRATKQPVDVYSVAKKYNADSKVGDKYPELLISILEDIYSDPRNAPLKELMDGILK